MIWGIQRVAQGKISILIALVAATIVAVAAGAYVLLPSGTVRVALRPNHADTVKRGTQVYRQHCASCHGADLEGQGNWRSRDADGYLPAPPHDASGHTWHHSDRALFKLTKLGPRALAGDGYKTKMPAYDGIISDQDIIDVLSYIKSRWPDKIQKRHDQINARSVAK